MATKSVNYHSKLTITTARIKEARREWLFGRCLPSVAVPKLLRFKHYCWWLGVISLMAAGCLGCAPYFFQKLSEYLLTLSGMPLSETGSSGSESQPNKLKTKDIQRSRVRLRGLQVVAKLCLLAFAFIVSLPFIVYAAVFTAISMGIIEKVPPRFCPPAIIIESQSENRLGVLELYSSSTLCDNYVSAKTELDAVDRLMKLIEKIEGKVDGIDFLSGARAIFWRGKTGAATPVEQVVRTAAGRGNRHGMTTLDKLLTKPLDLWDTAKLDVLERDSILHNLIATHLPCIIGAAGSGFGTPINGIELCSRLLFKKSASEISWAEMSILVALVKYPFQAGPYKDQAAAHLQKQRWEKKIKPRAALAIKRALPMEEAAYALDELSKMTMPSVHADDHPVRKLMKVLGGGKSALRTELRHLTDKDGYIRDSYTIGLDSDNELFAHEIIHALKKIEARNSTRLRQCLTEACKKETKADILALIAVDGSIRNIYSTGRSDLLWGNLPGRNQTDRPIGSVGKMTAALALAQKHSQLCNLYHGGIRNPDGDTGHANCRQSEAWVNLDEAYRKSMNLPIIWGLSRFRNSFLKSLMTDTAMQPTNDKTPLAYSIPFGLATASPAILIQQIDAIHKGVDSLPPISNAVGFAYNQKERGDTMNLSPYFTDPISDKRVKKMLSAPMKAGGTLQTLGKKILPGKSIAKSGTSEIKTNDGVRDRLMIASTYRDGKYYQMFLLIGSSDPKKPLAITLPSSFAEDVWDVFARTIMQED